MKKVVLDTNILVDFLRQSPKATVFGKLMRQKDLEIFLPAVVLTELYIGKSAGNPAGEKRLEEALRELKFVSTNEEISRQAGILMRQNPNFYLADALVAATALNLQAPLCTFNKSHFENIFGLKFFARENLLTGFDKKR
ncbi:type II toxin-antitoxin system VapC family toxin [Candidatus Shapirobacteria bacterium]|nr:type II toxin-antitoxin system VapC family toxin [Candidatus Shapirobacteria bacterium]